MSSSVSQSMADLTETDNEILDRAARMYGFVVYLGVKVVSVDVEPLADDWLLN